MRRESITSSSRRDSTNMGPLRAAGMPWPLTRHPLVRRTFLAGEIFSIGQPWRSPPSSASLRGRPRKPEARNRYGNGLLPPNADGRARAGPPRRREASGGGLMPRLLVFNRSYPPDVGATGRLLGGALRGPRRAPRLGGHGRGGPAGGRAWPTAGERAGLREHRARGVTVIRAWGTRRPKGRFADRAANYLSYFGRRRLPGSVSLGRTWS